MLDFIKIFILVCVSVFCVATHSFAATLESIEINPAKNNFDVILNSTDKIKVSKKIYPEKMILNLKNTNIAKNFNIKYNHTNLDDVVVKQGKNNVQITVKSKDITIPANKNNKYLLLSILLLLGFVKRPKKVDDNKIKLRVKIHNNNNIDYILKNKCKNKEEEKIKIAA